ncbi:hypothetical protein AB0H07_19970 [Streptomyces sp. NPDC021354]|uniref:WD40 repeat domain-containing protein n=1 Tax=Streptomyces sp. NPDC021354 TaxID=3154793 RepID=UPI0034073BD2
MATGSEDRTVRLYEVAGGGGVREPALPAGHAKPVDALAFSPDGQVLATGGARTGPRFCGTPTPSVSPPGSVTPSTPPSPVPSGASTSPSGRTGHLAESGSGPGEPGRGSPGTALAAVTSSNHTGSRARPVRRR